MKFLDDDNLKSFEEAISQAKLATERTTALYVASILNRVLEELLHSFFVDDTKLTNKLLSGLGPLANFFARIEIAVALGLISKVEHHDLNLIRRIRNYFAHYSDLTLSFNTDVIKSKCMRLQTPSSDPREVIKSDVPLIINTPGDRFYSAFGVLLFTIIDRRDKLSHRDIPTPLSKESLRAKIDQAVKSDS